MTLPLLPSKLKERVQRSQWQEVGESTWKLFGKTGDGHLCPSLSVRTTFPFVPVIRSDRIVRPMIH